MPIESFADVNLATMTAWAADRAGLDTELQEKFDRVVTSPIAPEVAAHFPEVVYAHMDKFSKATRDLAADVCDWAAGQGFYGLRENQRGLTIAKALRGTKIAAADLPVPMAQFKAVATEASPPPGVAPTPPAPPAA